MASPTPPASEDEVHASGEESDATDDRDFVMAHGDEVNVDGTRVPSETGEDSTSGVELVEHFRLRYVRPIYLPP